MACIDVDIEDYIYEISTDALEKELKRRIEQLKTEFLSDEYSDLDRAKIKEYSSKLLEVEIFLDKMARYDLSFAISEIREKFFI